MKNTILLMVTCLFVGVISAQAQRGEGMPRRTVEERATKMSEKTATALSLDANQTVLTDSAFAGYFRGMEKLRNGMQQDQRSAKADFEKLMAERNEKLQKIFTADQYKKFKEEVEPSLHPKGKGKGNRPQPNS